MPADKSNAEREEGAKASYMQSMWKSSGATTTATLGIWVTGISWASLEEHMSAMRWSRIGWRTFFPTYTSKAAGVQCGDLE